MQLFQGNKNYISTQVSFWAYNKLFIIRYCNLLINLHFNVYFLRKGVRVVPKMSIKTSTAISQVITP